MWVGRDGKALKLNMEKLYNYLEQHKTNLCSCWLTIIVEIISIVVT